MSKPTGGPWYLSPTGRYVRYTGVHGANICDLDVFEGPEEEGRANAHLILAAPRLLAALEAIIEASNANPEPIHFAVREAISKAREAVLEAREGAD